MKVFTTKIIDGLMDQYLLGHRTPRSNSFTHQNIIGTRKSGINFLMTNKEMIEWSKCYNDINYFSNIYTKIKLEDGSTGQMKLRDYQKEALEFVDKQRFSIFLRSRQVGLTVVLAIHFLHSALFNNKKIVIIPNKGLNGIEFIRKIKDIYKLLPFFLKGGIVKWTERSIEFENGGKIDMVVPTKEFVHDVNTDITLINEMSRIINQESIYHEIFKKLKRDAQIIIDSGLNGNNFFYSLLRDSERHIDDPQRNIFETKRIWWWQVPGRGDKWKQEQILCLGSKEMWDQEYDLCFVLKNNK